MIYLDLADVLAASHAALGATPQIRDLGLLQSAIARPQATAFGDDAYPTLYDKAAALCHSIATNHALVDGNKRTALASTLLFLELNGVRLAPNPDAFDLLVEIASGKLRDVNQIAARLRSWPTHP